MQDNKEDKGAEAEAATARLQKGLRSAKSLLLDYKARLCRLPPRESDARIFRFDR